MARKTPAPVEEFDEHIIDTDITDEMSSSYIEYAYSVIYSRAIPDARDGLKPVQRRTLYTMDDMNLRHDRGHVKSARVVGDVMGRLHPHGDGAIYDALVRLVQPWSMRLPLVDGHGHEHRAAQPHRGRAGAQAPHRPPRGRSRRRDEVRAWPRPPHRRQDRRP